MNPLVVIPARMASSRFPGKPLYSLAGRPLLRHALNAAGDWPVVVATEDREIEDWCREQGVWCINTGPARNGTERTAAVNRRLGYPVVVNVQCDEPDLTPDDLRRVVAGLGRAPVATLACPLPPAGEFDEDAVKVAVGMDGIAKSFTRGAVPHAALHVGIYAYCQEALLAYSGWAPSELEQTESLEQLRFVERRLPIAVELVNRRLQSINRHHDIAKWERANTVALPAA